MTLRYWAIAPFAILGILQAEPLTLTAQQTCHPSYPTVCIPPPPPDLDCPDIPYTNFRVVGDDPHRFDGDNDGIGCER